MRFHLFQRELSTTSYEMSEDLEYVLIKHDIQKVTQLTPPSTNWLMMAGYNMKVFLSQMYMCTTQ